MVSNFVATFTQKQRGNLSAIEYS